MVSKRTLIFPAGMPRSIEFLESASSDGVSIVGSSSLAHDPVQARYPLWIHLPYVTDPEFDDALRSAIRTMDIGRIFTPNPVVWEYLHRSLADAFPGVNLVNQSPIEAETAPYRRALEFGHSVHDDEALGVDMGRYRDSVSALELAALARHAETIPGMCDQAKIRGLSRMARNTPHGDILEIGSWWGKSAFVLLRLAQLYGIGSVLCVDPWSDADLIQDDADGDLVNQVHVDADEAFEIFQLNILPYASEGMNFLRCSSVEAAGIYRSEGSAVSVSFGETAYSGRISILHVDGNHDYDSVCADAEAWVDLVVPGGWVVLDDYVWPFGDGPRRVGDAFVRGEYGEIRSSFVIGSALFLQRG